MRKKNKKTPSVRQRKTLRVTPATAAGVAKTV
jgi:hypothetical protein